MLVGARLMGKRFATLPGDAVGFARDLSKADDDKRRLTYGFRLCTSRTPTDAELSILQNLLDEQRTHFQADATATKKLLAQGDAKIDEALAPAEVAAWSSVGSTLLNLDATIRR